MRGEHQTSGPRNLGPLGSSPHARGALDTLFSTCESQRIIPACAGSTRGLCLRYGSCRDHPRMRGEHEKMDTSIANQTGSSPHARGALSRAAPERARRGIIPACAGSTKARPRRWRCCRDHPRMRGEHSPAPRLCAGARGSSPHARGAPNVPINEGSSSGIIPACAGSTPGLVALTERARDHPRMRGEHTQRVSLSQVHTGSSPHARGAPRGVSEARAIGGIIPACAGSTPRRRCRAPLTGDHPRMRGEHGKAHRHRRRVPGSSPHARGARGVGGPRGTPRGIIPACAGSTFVAQAA